MLMVNQLNGFGSRSSQFLLNNATGTNIGSASFSSGSLSNWFDSVTNTVLASCGRVVPQPAWGGKYFSGAPKLWSGFKIWSPSNALISGSLGAHTGTWEFYVKPTGQSTTQTDGTLVATGTWSEPASFTSQYTVSSLDIPPTLGESAFVRVRFISNAGDDVNLAEIQLYYEV